MKRHHLQLGSGAVALLWASLAPGQPAAEDDPAPKPDEEPHAQVAAPAAPTPVPSGSGGGQLRPQPAEPDSEEPPEEPAGGGHVRPGVGADELFLQRVPPFLQRSHVYWGSPLPKKKHLLFAAEYALHIPVLSTLRQQALDGKDWAFAFTITFGGYLRMSTENSKPVRMPSYRPQLTFQVFRILQQPAPWVIGFSPTLYHHSNGQDGCAFDENLPDDLSGPCTELHATLTDPAAQLNRRDGSFSTNRLGASLNAARYSVDRNGFVTSTLGFGLRVERNIGTDPGGITKATQRLYGWGELALPLEYELGCGWLICRGEAVLAYFPQSGPSIPNYHLSALAAARPANWHTTAGFGLFLKYFHGRDFYNGFFVDRINQLQIGLEWIPDAPLRFDHEWLQPRQVHGG